MGPIVQKERCGIYTVEIFPHSFRERVSTKLRWSREDDTNLDDVRQTLTEVALDLEAEEASRTQEYGVDRRKRRAMISETKRSEKRTSESTGPKASG